MLFSMFVFGAPTPKTGFSSRFRRFAGAVVVSALATWAVTVAGCGGAACLRDSDCGGGNECREGACQAAAGKPAAAGSAGKAGASTGGSSGAGASAGGNGGRGGATGGSGVAGRASGGMSGTMSELAGESGMTGSP